MRIAMYEGRGSVRGGLNRIANRPMQIKMEIRFHPSLSTRSTTEWFRFSVFAWFFPRSEKLQAFFPWWKTEFRSVNRCKTKFPCILPPLIKEIKREGRNGGGGNGKRNERRKIVDTKKERYLLDCINRKAIERYRREIRSYLRYETSVSGKDKRRETFLPSSRRRRGKEEETKHVINEISNSFADGDYRRCMLTNEWAAHTGGKQR